jgi:hypothetical protein
VCITGSRYSLVTSRERESRERLELSLIGYQRKQSLVESELPVVSWQ